MNDALQRAWYRGALWFWPFLPVLWPLSLLFCALARYRRSRLQGKSQPLPVPVVVVGNISVGGTGKTPLLCALAQALRQRGRHVGIISRGYGGSHRGAPRRVTAADAAAVVGDEPLLLARTTACPVVIGADRLAAAQRLIAEEKPAVILSDDGLQHYALPRTIEIAVLDGSRGLGNRLCLPAGPLREPPSRLREVDFVVINGNRQQGFRADELSVMLEPQGWLPVGATDLLPLSFLPAGCTVHAVAGIGNPARFFATLRDLGLQIIEHPLPDHHGFRAADLVFNDGLPVVMTEKDAVKCAGIAPGNAYALRVAMPLPDSWVDTLLQRMDEQWRRTA